MVPPPNLKLERVVSPDGESSSTSRELAWFTHGHSFLCLRRSEDSRVAHRKRHVTRAFMIYSHSESSALDQFAYALTGTNMTLLPDLITAMMSGLLLEPDMGEAFAAHDEDGVLVGYLIFSLPGKLLFAT